MRAVAVAFTREEREFLIRILRAWIEIGSDDPLAWDLLAMLENAVEPGLVASLERE